MMGQNTYTRQNALLDERSKKRREHLSNRDMEALIIKETLRRPLPLISWLG